MLLNFRQGIASYSALPQYIQLNSDGSVSLNTSAKPIVLSFAHGGTNYLYTETTSINNAWNGFIPIAVSPTLTPTITLSSSPTPTVTPTITPSVASSFTPTMTPSQTPPSTQYWLYWDIDLITAKRGFGVTTNAPLFGNNFPDIPKLDQHFFSIPNMKMYYWNGMAWVESIRVFAGSIINGKLNTISLGTQVNINTPVNVGEILFDVNKNPVKRYTSSGYEFLTTVDTIPPENDNLVNIKVNGLDINGISNSYIPKYYCVLAAGTDSNGTVSVVKASYFNNNYGAFALTSANMLPGQTKQLITNGFVQDPEFEWNAPTFTPLFVGGDGELTLIPNNEFSIQKVGYVVNPTTIFIKFERQISLTVNNPIYVSPTPSITPSPTFTPTLTPTISVTNSVTPTLTNTPTPSLTPSITPSITVTPSFTVTPTVSTTMSNTLTPTPSVTISPTHTPTPTLTPSNSVTPSHTLTPTPTVTPT